MSDEETQTSPVEEPPSLEPEKSSGSERVEASDEGASGHSGTIVGKAMVVAAVLLGLGTGLLGLTVVLLAGSGLHDTKASIVLVLSLMVYGVSGYLVGIRDTFESPIPLASDYGAAASFGHLGLVMSIVLMVPGEFKHGALFAMAFLPMGLIFVGAWFGDQMRPKNDEGLRA